MFNFFRVRIEPQRHSAAKPQPKSATAACAQPAAGPSLRPALRRASDKVADVRRRDTGLGILRKTPAPRRCRSSGVWPSSATAGSVLSKKVESKAKAAQHTLNHSHFKCGNPRIPKGFRLKAQGCEARATL